MQRPPLQSESLCITVKTPTKRAFKLRWDEVCRRQLNYGVYGRLMPLLERRYDQVIVESALVEALNLVRQADHERPQ